MKPQGKVTIFMVVMIVMLSVYYFFIPDKEVDKATTTQPNSQNVIRSEEYEQLRNDLEESRQTMITMLNGVLASTDVSVEDKNTAIESIQKIQTIAQNEGLLEIQVMNIGYDDVFVQKDDGVVNVSVYVDNLTVDEVNDIILMAKSQFGSDVDVTVKFTIVDVN